MEFKDNLRNLVWRLQEILENAPCEEYYFAKRKILVWQSIKALKGRD